MFLALPSELNHFAPRLRIVGTAATVSTLFMIVIRIHIDYAAIRFLLSGLDLRFFMCRILNKSHQTELTKSHTIYSLDLPGVCFRPMHPDLRYRSVYVLINTIQHTLRSNYA